MGTFFRTFLCCLVIALGFFVYKFLMSESYSPDLSVSNENPVFSSYNKFDKMQEEKENTNQQNNEIQPKEDTQKFEYTCYFYTSTGKLTAVKREFSIQQSLENTIAMLIKGPTIKEEKQGIYSEIPKNTDVIYVKQNNDSVIVNLTSAFGQGGGSQSVENRVKQISKTVKNRVKNKKVYLYIDNKEVEYLGGEGVYIKQPLE